MKRRSVSASFKTEVSTLTAAQNIGCADNADYQANHAQPEHLCEVLPSVSPSLSSSLFLHLGLYFLLLAAILIRPIPPFYCQGSTGSMGRVFDGQSCQSNNSALIFGVHSLGRIVVPKAQSPERHINKGLVQDSVPEKVSQMEIPNNSWQVLQRKTA